MNQLILFIIFESVKKLKKKHSKYRNFSGILSLVSYFFDVENMVNLYVALVLFLFVFVMCSMSFYEEKKALIVIKGFANLLPQQCTVRRNGTDKTIVAEQLVVGDLVWIRHGEKVTNFILKLKN